MNRPTRLDPGHIATSLSADQMIQVARAVGLEVILASYRHLEDLFLRARGASGLGVREQRGRSPLTSFFGSAVADSVALQSK